MSSVRLVPMPPPASVEFRYTQTESFPAVLRELGAALVITTYQANKLLVARATDDGLSMLVRSWRGFRSCPRARCGASFEIVLRKAGRCI